MIRFYNRVVLAKIEGTYGTDSVATGEANAIRVRVVEITPLAGEGIERTLVRPFTGGFEQLRAGEHVMMRLTVELAGSGTAGTAPAWGPLARACGLDETIDEGTDVQYQPVSADEESVSVYFHIGTNKHAMTGARGKASLRFPAGQVPEIIFELRGLWAAPANATLPTPVFDDWIVPVPVNKANTPVFTLHSLAAVMESLEIDLGHDVQHRDLVGAESIEIIDRATTGRVSIEAPAVSSKNFFTIAASHPPTLGALALTHGTVAGNIVQVACPKVQVMNPAYADRRGIAMLGMELGILPDEGDDEIVITVK